MFRRWLEWLERCMEGGGGQETESAPGRVRPRLRVCFDARGETGGHPVEAGDDLTVLPGAWHLRDRLLDALVQLLTQTANANQIAFELVVLHDREDERMVRRCASLSRVAARSLTICPMPR